MSFLTLIEGTSTTTGLTFSIEAITTLFVKQNVIENYSLSIIDASGLDVREPRTRMFIRELVSQWLRGISVIENPANLKPIDKTYISINGSIDEAYVVETGNGTEYRDRLTGLIMGGIHRLTYRWGSTIYDVIVTSYLTNIEPREYLNNLCIINLNTDLITSLGLIYTGVVFIASVIILIRWSNYRIV